MEYFKKGNLAVEIYNDRKEMALSAAESVLREIESRLQSKKEVNVVFAAAPSQDEFLEALTADKMIDWTRVNAFHLDEYVGLKEEAPQKFGNYLKQRLFAKLPFREVHYINSEANDCSDECRRYADLLEGEGLDIACLGIGENGHLAFNDPDVAKFKDREKVKIVKLDETCRQQQVNDKCFEKIDDVPTHAFTLTIPILMSADKIFCLVPGKTKAKAVYETLNNGIEESCPASILRQKTGAILYLDKDSASLLKK